MKKQEIRKLLKAYEAGDKKALDKAFKAEVIADLNNVGGANCQPSGKKTWRCIIWERHNVVAQKTYNGIHKLQFAHGMTNAGYPPEFAVIYDLLGKIGECKINKLALDNSVSLTCREKGRKGP